MSADKYLQYLEESGQRFVTDSFAESNSVADAVSLIQDKCGLGIDCCEPAIEFLDVLEESRSNVFAAMLDKLKSDLLTKISTSSKEDLSKLLLECIRFIKISQLKPIVIAIINRLGELPLNHLQIIVRGQLLDDMPPSIKRQAWEKSPKLFVDWMKKMSGTCSLSNSNYTKAYIKSLCEVVLGSVKLCFVVSQFYMDYARSMSLVGSGTTAGGDMRITGALFYRDFICHLGTPPPAGAPANDMISLSQRTIPQFSMLSTIALTIRAILGRKYVLMGKASAQQKFGSASEDTVNECKILYNTFKSLVSSQLSAVNQAILGREAKIRSLSSAADSHKRKREDMFEEIPARGKPTGPASVVNILPVAQWPVVVPPESQSSPVSVSDEALRKILNDMVTNVAKLDKQLLFGEPVTEAVAPNYFSVIKQPMDISTIRRKVSFGSYSSLTELEEDIYRMLHNATVYNKPGDFVYTEAGELYKQWLKARKRFHVRYATGDAPAVAKAKPATPAPVATPVPTSAAADADEEEGEEEDDILPVAKWPSPTSIAGADVILKGVPKDKIAHIFKEMAKAVVKMDTNSFFLVPVTEDVAPDYFSVISKPMDMGSIQMKIGRNMYKSLSALEEDIYRMLHNATVYNPPGDVVYEYAVELYKKWLVERKSFIKNLVSLNPDAASVASAASAAAATSAALSSSIKAEPMDMSISTPNPNPATAAPAPAAAPSIPTKMLPVSEWPCAESVTGDAINLEGVPKTKVVAIYQEIMDAIMKIDFMNTFLSPVTEAVAPGYFSVIKQPMDISTIRSKIKRGMYKSLSALEEDIYRMLHNATVFNKPGDLCYNEAMVIYDKWLTERNAFIQKLVDLGHKDPIPAAKPVSFSVAPIPAFNPAAATTATTTIAAADAPPVTQTAVSAAAAPSGITVSSSSNTATAAPAPAPAVALVVPSGSDLILPVSKWPSLNSIDGSVNDSDCLSADVLVGVYQAALKTLIKLDSNGWFSQPVSEAIAPGYFALISQPMDISTIQSKAAQHAYKSFSNVEEDIYRMLHNATVYNKAGHAVHEEAVAVYKKWQTNRKHTLKKIVQLCLAARGAGKSNGASNEPAAAAAGLVVKVRRNAEPMEVDVSDSEPSKPEQSSVAAGAVVVKKEDETTGSEVGSPAPAVTTRAASGDSDAAAATPADKRSEQMEILQKEKKVLASLRAAASRLSATDAHSQKASSGGGLSFLGHHAPVATAASAVIDELPNCLTDAVLKNALLLCSNTPALREIWCKACVQSIIVTSLAPVVKTLNSQVGPNGTINTALPLLPADHAETRFLFQMFQISMLGNTVRDYDQLPAIDAIVFRLFVPHMLRQLLEFIIAQQHSKSAVRMTIADAQNLVTEWKYLGYVESTEDLARMEPSLDLLGKYLVEYGMKLIKA